MLLVVPEFSVELDQSLASYNCNPVLITGVGLGKSLSGRRAAKKAIERAANYLVHVPRYEGDTVHHNMFVQYHRSKMFITQQREGLHRCVGSSY